jgi:hypothetical protein
MLQYSHKSALGSGAGCWNGGYSLVQSEGLRISYCLVSLAHSTFDPYPCSEGDLQKRQRAELTAL